MNWFIYPYVAVALAGAVCVFAGSLLESNFVFITGLVLIGLVLLAALLVAAILLFAFW